jgi:hypothetical protein
VSSWLSAHRKPQLAFVRRDRQHVRVSRGGCSLKTVIRPYTFLLPYLLTDANRLLLGTKRLDEFEQICCYLLYSYGHRVQILHPSYDSLYCLYKTIPTFFQPYYSIRLLSPLHTSSALSLLRVQMSDSTSKHVEKCASRYQVHRNRGTRDVVDLSQAGRFQRKLLM